MPSTFTNRKSQKHLDVSRIQQQIIKVNTSILGGSFQIRFLPTHWRYKHKISTVGAENPFQEDYGLKFEHCYNINISCQNPFFDDCYDDMFNDLITF